MHLLPFSGPGHMTEGQASGAAIAFEQVEKGFGDRKVLDKVSFTVAQGEAVCILGRSGTGKSVTLKLMIGLLMADAGKVLVTGKDMSTLDEHGLVKVRRKMGYLFQSAALFDSFTVNENLAMPLHRLDPDKSPEEIKRVVEETLGEVGLGKDGNKMPSALSGGMQKRAGLARALVLQPEILLVDEPASGLDRITASEIDDLLLGEKTKRKTTMVIVTHDARGARRIGDRFAVLDQGCLLALGRADELDYHGNAIVQKLFEES